MKDHVTDFATSKKLWEAGVRGEHHWVVAEGIENPIPVEMVNNCGIDEQTILYPAYMLGELLGMIEGSFDLVKRPMSRPGFILVGYLGTIRHCIIERTSAIQAAADALLWQRGM
ncbi:MAG: hypothetical protein JXA07_04045 [Spirochaetes bacterium]|nr:hypothetical protein [Spirochaetota bacterium]